jgi:hypothetical protein
MSPHEREELASLYVLGALEGGVPSVEAWKRGVWGVGCGVWGQSLGQSCILHVARIRLQTLVG